MQTGFIRFSSLTVFAALVFLTSCGGGDGDSGSSDSGSGPAQDACGDIGLKVLNGSECNGGTSPVVRLIIAEAALCTGTMITGDTVLTAAHCVTSEEGVKNVGDDSIQVSTDGSLDTIAHSTKITVHPDFRADTAALQRVLDPITDRETARLAALQFIRGHGVADVAIITLDQSLNLRTLAVSTTFIPPANTGISVFGYGDTVSDDPNQTGQVVSGRMTIDAAGSNDFTAPFDGSLSFICSGDSGGPATVSLGGASGTVTGIAQASISKVDNEFCAPGAEALFTATAGSRVANFIKSEAPGALFR